MTKRWTWAPCCVIALIASLALPMVETAVHANPSGFEGVVSNMGSGLGIPGVRISAAGQSVTTDGGGHYSLPLPSGMYKVRAEAPGYVGMTQDLQRLDGTTWARLDFQMIPLNPNPEEAAVIDARMMSASQEPPSDGTTMSRGFGLSSVTDASATIRVLMPDDTVVVLPMDEYLKGVVPHEMPPYWPAAALRAQAVAARSYAITRLAHEGQGADVCTTTHCQVWSATHYDTTDQAVDDTHGVVAKYDGKVIYAFYFAHCDGHTRNSQDVWGGDLPYCRSVACPCGHTTMQGHGVGMCQHGARALAQGGYDYVGILKHFYTGIEVSPPAAGAVTTASVEPASGDESTQFTFRATYTHPTGDAPVVANVIIDGRAHALIRASGSTGNQWHYELTTTLPAGEHTHLFYFDDGYGHVSRAPESGSLDGPMVTESNPPLPTPTPVPPEAGQVLARSIVYSTEADWAEGSSDGVSVAAVGDGALVLADGHAEGVYTSTALTAPLPFIGLGVTWYASTPDDSAISLEVRTSPDGVSWDAWQPIRETEGSERPTLHLADLLFGEGIALQFRANLQAGSNGASPTLENLRLVCIDSRSGPTASELASMPRPAADGPPPIIPRSGWSADESIMTWPPEYRPIRAIILHHTATDDGGVDPVAMVRAIYYYHALVREWGDIGYNFLIDSMGNIYEGRAGGAEVVGAHARRFNWGSVGIALIGDFYEEEPTATALDSLTAFLAWQCIDYAIDPTGQRVFIDTELPTIMGHRDCGSTTCPGDRAYSLLPAIRSQTWARMVDIEGAALDGSASVPEWSNTTSVQFVLTSTNALAVQFSNNWIWEGEELYCQENTSQVITDTDALNGLTRVGRVGDPNYGRAGYWYGPYTCELPGWRDYQAYFRLKNPNSSAQVQLATLDVADDQGHNIYATRTLMGTDFCQDDVYQEFRLDLSYGSQPTSCDHPEQVGLEFRTQFLGMGDLFLDRVTVFGAPESLVSPLTWEVRDVEGPQTVTVRFLSAMGNSRDRSVTVKLDMTSPDWQSYGARSVSVQDALSGLDTASAACASSPDGGATWGAWQPITLTASSGITLPIQLVAPDELDGSLRFRIQDMAGNASESHPLPAAPPRTPEAPNRLTLPLIMMRQPAPES